MRKTLRHEEPDRVPISDFFWGGFTRRWREELQLPADASPYYHYDLDWIATVHNMDPWIRAFETVQETAEEVVVNTTVEGVIKSGKLEKVKVTPESRASDVIRMDQEPRPSMP